MRLLAFIAKVVREGNINNPKLKKKIKVKKFTTILPRTISFPGIGDLQSHLRFGLISRVLKWMIVDVLPVTWFFVFCFYGRVH